MVQGNLFYKENSNADKHNTEGNLREKLLPVDNLDISEQQGILI